MRQKVVYCCDFCATEFDTLEKCHRHEAAHFNLSYEEFLLWKTYCREAAHAGKAFGTSHNRTTEAKFDAAVKTLVDFEEKYSLLNIERKPSDFYY